MGVARTMGFSGNRCRWVRGSLRGEARAQPPYPRLVACQTFSRAAASSRDYNGGRGQQRACHSPLARLQGDMSRGTAGACCHIFRRVSARGTLRENGLVSKAFFCFVFIMLFLACSRLLSSSLKFFWFFFLASAAALGLGKKLLGIQIIIKPYFSLLLCNLKKVKKTLQVLLSSSSCSVLPFLQRIIDCKAQRAHGLLNADAAAK